MLWITISTDNEVEFLDAVNFVIQENGSYSILCLDGSKREGLIKDIKFLHVEAVKMKNEVAKEIIRRRYKK